MMVEPGTPLPWERSGLHFGQRGQEWIGSVDAYHWSTLEEHERAGKDASYIVEACNAYPQLQKDVADLNRLLRDVGWGQGEIDTAAVVSEENEQLRAALRKLVDAARAKEWDQESQDQDGWFEYCSFCQVSSNAPHNPDHCDYAAAIAEAERLLNEN